MMKTNVLTVLSAVVLAACGNNPQKTTAAAPQSDGIEVLYFHGAKRCATCIAIENGTKEVETGFTDPIADGKVRFRIVDLSQPENEALGDRYEVTWSALLVIQRQNGKEMVDDVTEFAFAHARSNPERFKAELKSRIEKLLGE